MTLRVPVSEKDHIAGNANATVELVEYGDYQCPYCGRAYPMVKRIKERMGSDLKFVFRNFPLTKVHPQAKIASIATEAAARQGKFWEMHDIIFENQKRLHGTAIMEYAEQLGLDTVRLSKDMEDTELIKKVASDFENGLRSGVNATPTFFVNGEKYAWDWDENALEQYLREKMQQPS